MTKAIAGVRAAGRARRWWRPGVAAVIVVALAAAACGGGSDEASGTTPEEAKALAAKYKSTGILPNLCKFLTVEEVEEATGKDVSEAHEFPTQCAYYTPDKKDLVASVLAERPGTVDYDDLEHTRDAEKQKGIEGADRAVFLAPFHIMAALKADIYLAVQVPAMRKDGASKVKEATRELLEVALARL